MVMSSTRRSLIPDKILAVRRDGVSECDLGIADLLILLEGDVPADHVVEEDAQ